MKSKEYSKDIQEIKEKLDEIAKILIKIIPTEKLEEIYLSK